MVTMLVFALGNVLGPMMGGFISGFIGISLCFS